MSYTHRSTARVNFPGAVSALKQGRLDQLEKLEGIASGAISDGRKMQNQLKKARTQLEKQGLVEQATIDEIEERMWYLSSTGSTVNSWAEED